MKACAYVVGPGEGAGAALLGWRANSAFRRCCPTSRSLPPRRNRSRRRFSYSSSPPCTTCGCWRASPTRSASHRPAASASRRCSISPKVRRAGRFRAASKWALTMWSRYPSPGGGCCRASPGSSIACRSITRPRPISAPSGPSIVARASSAASRSSASPHQRAARRDACRTL